MKGQSSILIILAMVVVVMVTWAFASFNQANISGREVFSLMMSKVTGKMDTLRGFFKDALTLSGYAASDIVGNDENKTFYCNGPSVPSENEMRVMLSDQSVEILNAYKNNLKFNDPLLTVKIKDFTCVDIPNDGRVKSGQYDEGFNINAYGSDIQVIREENVINGSNDVFEYVTDDRFWFLYRKISYWVDNNGGFIYSHMCNCLDNLDCTSKNACDSGQCPVFGSCVEDAFKIYANSLKKYINDQYVTCSGVPNCCATEKGPSCQPDPRTSCDLLDYGECFDCKNYSSELCIDKISAQTCGGVCSYWESGKASVNGLITCRDEKYQLSVPGKDRHLEFTIEIVSSLEKNGINVDVWNCDSNCECQGSCGGCEASPIKKPPTKPYPGPNKEPKDKDKFPEPKGNQPHYPSQPNKPTKDNKPDREPTGPKPSGGNEPKN
ncbi:hypothetical protein A3K63_03840 [Candidatus Micrarchaeota archaeon RBG_16_49_10]|nr:MAG: hypothetical protein A3K63_03840 [Candidatus Micrarchaeota archaeon RBG_16_49_10]